MALKQKIILLAFILAICSSHVLASTSTTYQIHDESLNFGYNAGFLESTTYAMDLGGITWVERNSESGSYILIDGNSISGEDVIIPPPPPPPPPSPSGGEAGGRILPEEDEVSDVPVVSDIPIEEEEMHEAAPEEVEEIIEEPIIFIEPVEVFIDEEVEIEEEKPVFIYTEEEGFIHYDTSDVLDEYDFITELDYKIEPIEIEIPSEDQLESYDGEVVIEGKTGSNYEITAIWIGDNYVVRSVVDADEQGEFVVKTPEKLSDGEYMVLFYGLEITENKIVQTKYSTVKFKIIDGKAYLKDIECDVKSDCVCWHVIALYLIIILITLYTLWRKYRK